MAKEEIAGLLVALRVFIEKDIESEMKQAKKLLEIISKDIQSLNSDKISTLIKSPSNKEQYPTLNIHSENINLFELSNQLKTKDGLFLNETGLNQKFLTIHPMNLSNENINKISSVLKASIKEFIKNGN